MSKVMVSLGFLLSAFVGGIVSQVVVIPLRKPDPPLANAGPTIFAQHIIATEKIEIVDLNGKTRIGMGVLKNGESTLWLNDSTGIPRVFFSCGEEAAVSVAVKNGHALLQVNKDGAPSLSLTQDDEVRAVLGVANVVATKTGDKTETAASTLTLFGKDKKVLWQAPR